MSASNLSPFALRSPTGSNSVSPLPLSASASKQSARKKQSSLKSVVHEFGQLIITWERDLSHADALFDSVLSLYQNASSLNLSLANVHSSLSLQLHESFPDVFQRLLGSLLQDIEVALGQLRLQQGRLSDDLVAIKMKYFESLKIFTGEVHEDGSGSDDLIFSTDHVNEIENITKAVTLETSRRLAALQAFLEHITDISIFAVDKRAIDLLFRHLETWKGAITGSEHSKQIPSPEAMTINNIQRK